MVTVFSLNVTCFGYPDWFSYGLLPPVGINFRKLAKHNLMVVVVVVVVVVVIGFSMHQFILYAVQ